MSQNDKDDYEANLCTNPRFIQLACIITYCNRMSLKSGERNFGVPLKLAQEETVSLAKSSALALKNEGPGTDNGAILSRSAFSRTVTHEPGLGKCWKSSGWPVETSRHLQFKQRRRITNCSLSTLLRFREIFSYNALLLWIRKEPRTW